MTRTTRTSRAAIGVAVAVALGVGSPAVAAAQGAHTKPSHEQVDKGSKGSKGIKGTDKGAKGDKGSKGADKGSKGSQAVRQVFAEIAKLDARLTLAGRDSRTADLADKDTVLLNIAADQASLAALKAELEAGGDPAVARETVRGYRPENYNLVVNDLRHAARLSELVAELTDALAGDAAAPVAELDAAAAALEAAVGAALLVGATSDKSQLDAVKAELALAHDALEVIEDHLEGLGEAEEEPTEEEPTDDSDDSDDSDEEPTDEGDDGDDSDEGDEGDEGDESDESDDGDDDGADEDPVLEEPVTP